MLETQAIQCGRRIGSQAGEENEYEAEQGDSQQIDKGL